MSTEQLILWVAQGVIALLVAAGGWMLRRLIGQVDSMREQLATEREGRIRLEGRVDGLGKLEEKLDQVLERVQEIRERIAARGLG